MENTTQLREQFEAWWRDRFNVPDFVPFAWEKISENDDRRFEAFCAGAALARESSPVQQADYVLMPHRLTAENGAKGLLSGEFKEHIEVTCYECGGDGTDSDGDDCETCEGDGHFTQSVTVDWHTIKCIYGMAVKHLAATPPAAQPITDEQMDKAHLDSQKLERMDGEDYGAFQQRAFRAAVRSILSQSPAPETVRDAWISVKDRMPPPETDVLVRCLRGFQESFDVAGVFHGEWMSCSTEYDTKGLVTHWMPLPKGPVDAAIQAKEGTGTCQ